jgi:CHAT domain-containing protein
LRHLRELAPRTAPARLPFFGMGDPILDEYQTTACDDVSARLDVRKGRPPASSIPTAELFGTGTIADGLRLADPAKLRMELEALPDSRCELEALSRLFGAGSGDLRLAAAATEAELKELSGTGRLRDYRVLALSTHGLLAGELESSEPALVLTPPETATAEDDGLLTAPEIAAIKLNAELVILSACNTAAGDAANPEQLAGLARAFFYAGAKSLLVSHWSVVSDSTAELMQLMVQERQRNPTIRPAEALRQAMLAFLDPARPNNLAEPDYWAPCTPIAASDRDRLQ